MTKQEHIDYWVRSADDDWEAVESLFEARKNIQCLFFAHLVLEKMLKAHWVQDNEGDIPPRTYNLVRLEDATQLGLDESDVLFLEEFNDFQLEGRYPDYLFEISRWCTSDITKDLLEKTKSLIRCLHEKML